MAEGCFRTKPDAARMQIIAERPQVCFEFSREVERIEQLRAA